MPQINSAGLNLIQHFEGCRLTAYPDPGTGGEPYTIGYGHTGLVNGKPVTLGMSISQDEANSLLAADLVKFEQEVNDLIAIDLTPNQFAALVSFQYNTGALGSSPGLALLNERQFEAAWDDHLCQYIRGGDGDVMQGLVERRAAERSLFFTP